MKMSFNGCNITQGLVTCTLQTILLPKRRNELEKFQPQLADNLNCLCIVCILPEVTGETHFPNIKSNQRNRKVKEMRLFLLPKTCEVWSEFSVNISVDIYPITTNGYWLLLLVIISSYSIRYLNNLTTATSWYSAKAQIRVGCLICFYIILLQAGAELYKAQTSLR